MIRLRLLFYTVRTFIRREDYLMKCRWIGVGYEEALRELVRAQYDSPCEDRYALAWTRLALRSNA